MNHHHIYRIKKSTPEQVIGFSSVDLDDLSNFSICVIELMHDPEFRNIGI